MKAQLIDSHDSQNSVASAMLNFDKLRDTPLKRTPYDYLTLAKFINSAEFNGIFEQFPRVAKGGSWPVENLSYGDKFRQLIAELESETLRQIIAEKFSVDLSDKPTMITIRGQGRSKDGGIHTDSLDKIITLLLYVNQDWPHSGGRLRILRNGTDINDYAEEIEPVQGNLLIFRRSDHSWHGHLPAADQRLSLQMNWMIDQKSRDSELKRHHRTAWLKKFFHGGY
ncbi:MAG: 2OG-Fe(II) oxygenase [Alphaproteobacteria bacterium]|nr:2OG-Fe(II) oxygenase [Alphaproteobacteria bacterium]